MQSLLDTDKQSNSTSDKNLSGSPSAFSRISPNSVRAEPYLRLAVPFWKYGIDWLVIILTLPAWLFLMAFITLGIKLVSRGPVLFRQKRIGYGNKPFLCLKFRSMKIGSDTLVHSQYMSDLISRNVPMVKLDQKGDSRLIRFGSFLRATGLDELPQIINVMRGEMSFVGPRPCTLAEFAQYAEWQKERFNTLPGLTGLWQVSGKNATTFNEMVRLDIQYARSKTVGTDLAIILKTFPAILAQMRSSR
ncbi:MAG: putative glycosyltransferase [Verrucomicrobiales bacterium]|nr:putative glycosyltransferase [Verrucomicrobiales bacterium]